MTTLRRLSTLIVILALTLAGCGDGATDDAATTTQGSDTTTASSMDAQVVLQNTSYDPSELTVAAGTTVTFTHQDDGIPHTVTADSGDFDSGQMASGDTFTVTPEEPGEIEFFCEVHPTQMRGTITVTEG